MPYTPLQRLPRAPLVYTVAMIEFGQLPESELEACAENIIRALRSEYPENRRMDIKTHRMRIEQDAVIPEVEQQKVVQWLLNNPDGDFGFSIGLDRLVVHTTINEKYHHFAERLNHITEVIAREANLTHSKNIGFRQVDNIVGIDDLTPQMQVKPNYLSPNLDNAFPMFSRVDHAYQSPIGQLHQRVYSLKGHPRVPQDLFHIAKEIKADKPLMEHIEEDFVLIDIDHIHMPNRYQPFDMVHIMEILEGLHKQSSMSFRAITTDAAMEAWSKEEGGK